MSSLDTRTAALLLLTAKRNVDARHLRAAEDVFGARLLLARWNVAARRLAEWNEAVLRALGDLPGHEFHGNQWTQLGALNSLHDKLKLHDARNPHTSAHATGNYVRQLDKLHSGIVQHLHAHPLHDKGKQDRLLRSMNDVNEMLSTSHDDPNIDIIRDEALQHMHNALIEIAYARKSPKVLAANRDTTPLHRVADSHYKQAMLVVSAAFMRGRKAYKSGGAEAAAKAIEASLTETLPAVLVKAYVGGALVGVRKIRTAGDYEGHPFHGNQWTEGSSGAADFEQRLGSLVAFHGTTADVVASIRAQGLRPDQTGRVFFASDREYAEMYAKMGKDLKGFSPVVIELRIPAEVLKDVKRNDEMHEYYLKGAVPPHWVQTIHALSAPVKSLTPVYAVLFVEEPIARGASLRVAKPQEKGGSSLLETLPAAFVKAYADGANVGLRKLRAAGDVEGHPFHGNQWTDSSGKVVPGVIGEGGVKIPSSDDKLTPEVIDSLFTKAGLPASARTEEGARRLFQERVQGQVLYHESPGDVAGSFKKGISNEEGTFAAVGVPSNYISGPKTVVAFRVPRGSDISPDESYFWSSKLTPEQVLLLQHPKVVGSYVFVNDIIRPKDIISIRTAELRTAGDVEGHPFHGNQYVIGYHGTSEEHVESIQAHGLRPDSNGNVFVVSDKAVAEHYAGVKTRYGNRQKGTSYKPVVIKVRVPKSISYDKWSSRAEGAPTYKIEGNIPKEWIEGFDVVEGRMLSAVELRALKPQIPGKPHERKPPFNLAFNLTDPRAVKWAKERAAELAKGISDSARDRIKEAVAGRLEGEDTYDEILAAVGSEARADVIARTETMRAANEGNRAGWLAAREDGLLGDDSRAAWIATSGCCDECDALDGETRELDGEYPDPGGEGPPLHPNCRCTEGIAS